MPGLIRNAILSRAAWLSKLMDPRRNIEQECGHPDSITVEEYKKMFIRGDVAARVVSLFPEETWCDDPEIYETEDETETEFETAWKVLTQKHPLFTYLQRADTLSGIGHFGVILLGVGDGQPLETPIAGIDEAGKMIGAPECELLYLRPFDESLVQIRDVQRDPSNPRYGQPTSYNVTFSDIVNGITSTPVITSMFGVHWSRVIHIADNRTNSEIYGSPRMERVLNRLLDLRKIAGGSGEMFWKGGFPGISLESHPSIQEEVEFDKEATKEQMEAYMNGLQRYIATVGMTANSLSVQVADPTPHVDLQLRLIATAMGVPWRVFIGSEAAQLASEQDSRSWNKRINRRRLDYINPFVLRPLIDRLIAIGVLPAPAEEGYQIDWQDMNSLSDIDKASVAEKESNALAKYVQGGVDALIPPFHYLTLVLGKTEEEADSIISAAEDQSKMVDGALAPPEPTPVQVVAGPNGKTPVGLPAGKVPAGLPAPKARGGF